MQVFGFREESAIQSKRGETSSALGLFVPVSAKNELSLYRFKHVLSRTTRTMSFDEVHIVRTI